MKTPAHVAPLEPNVRELFETHYRQHLADVRLHSGPEASKAAAELGAHAFARGANIYFSEPSWNPRLLAHEIAHVVQFARARSITSFVGSPDTVCESEADRAAEAVLAGAGFTIAARDAVPLIQLTPNRPAHHPRQGGQVPRQTPRSQHPGIVAAGAQRHISFGLPPLQLNFRHVDVAGLLRLPLPASVLVTHRSDLFQPSPAPIPQEPLTIPRVNVDRGMNAVATRGSFTRANPNDALAGEVFLSLVYQFDGYSTPNHLWDFFHQPTLTGTIGTNVLGGSGLAYHAAALSVSAVNRHFLDRNGQDLVEVSLLNLGVGVQDGNASLTAGVGAEFHASPVWSLTVNGMLSLNPTGSGIDVGGGVSFGVLVHGGPLRIGR